MKGKARFSLADGYLEDALKKVELHGSDIKSVNVKCSAHMLSIIWDENENENVAIGVKYFCNGGVHDAFIAPKGEVVLCGGTFNSAQVN